VNDWGIQDGSLGSRLEVTAKIQERNNNGLKQGRSHGDRKSKWIQKLLTKSNLIDQLKREQERGIKVCFWGSSLSY
jgi:hypothetical protein